MSSLVLSERAKRQAERAERLTRLLAPESESDTMDTICAHVAEGGVLCELTETWDVPFGLVEAWVTRDPVRFARYAQALRDCDSWARAKLLREVRRIGLVDVREFFNDNGDLKEMAELTADQAAAIASVEVEELLGGGRVKSLIGHKKKIKFWSKPDAIKMLGKQLGVFQDKLEIKAEATLLDAIAASRRPKDV